MSSTPIIDPEDAIILAQEGRISEVYAGKRKLSASTFSSFSSHSQPSQARSATLHSDSSSAADSIPEIEVPEFLESAETYHFVGLTEDVAMMTWLGYRGYMEEFPDEGPYDFMDFALLHIEEADIEDAGGSEDDWEGCMRAMGVTPKLMAAIMMPEFNDIRLTKSAKWWVKDSMQIQFGALEDIQETSRTRQRMRLEQTKQRKAGATYTQGLASSEEGEAGPSIASAFEAPLPHTPGYTTLYKGVNRQKASEFLNDSDGTINMNAIVSAAPTDFHPFLPRLDFGLSRSVAAGYVNYMKHRADLSAVSIIAINVPNALISAFNPYVLTFSTPKKFDEWREVIFYSRRGNMKFPRHLGSLQNQKLMIGPIAKSINKTFQRLKGPEEITMQHVLQLPNGEHATQYVFAVNIEVVGQLEESCRGQVTIYHGDPTFMASV